MRRVEHYKPKGLVRKRECRKVGYDGRVNHEVLSVGQFLYRYDTSIHIDDIRSVFVVPHHTPAAAGVQNGFHIPSKCLARQPTSDIDGSDTDGDFGRGESWG